MAISTLTICNMALSRVTAPRIQALTDPIREARECNLIYEIARDDVMSQYDWSFARKRAALAVLSGQDVDGWSFAYQLPTDCLCPRKIYNILGPTANPIPYEVMGRVLYTNQEEATLIYTYRATDPNLFDATFADVLAWRMAYELAVPLKNSIALREGNYKMYLLALGKASSKNMNVGDEEPKETNDFVDARS